MGMGQLSPLQSSEWLATTTPSDGADCTASLRGNRAKTAFSAVSLGIRISYTSGPVDGHTLGATADVTDRLFVG
jgi:hypothetical protein